VKPEAAPTLSEEDAQFLFNLLDAANVPATPNGLLGVSAPLTARVNLEIIEGGFAHFIRQSGTITSTDGQTKYGDISGDDFAQVERVTKAFGALWNVDRPGCCDRATTSTLAATVSCWRVVVPGEPVRCDITAQ
jgi:hypothetical protein